MKIRPKVIDYYHTAILRKLNLEEIRMLRNILNVVISRIEKE